MCDQLESANRSAHNKVDALYRVSPMDEPSCDEAHARPAVLTALDRYRRGALLILGAGEDRGDGAEEIHV